ncbi:PadR family transcriptional regulator [Phytopseudomonas dryadis]|uniref:PadR family transcriptional regulator n=1 Tax=Phytopseudomonas dryadis TaxID=2487520 RepID=A0ABY1ZBW8_9GAMM|nr:MULTISPECIES: PadR family transcriptional regulator [Pseudomonas]TBV09472.1 PadR family transcriptional regulator [Pseudomonas dryadis]TBV13385.1 PadR family transcriptional regulator [Pseudomonas sp. FRB 230]
MRNKPSFSATSPSDGLEEHRHKSRERGQRIFAPGDLKLLLLALIAETPSHGYDLIRRIEALFEGSYSPSPGVIYPTLTFLEESELIVSHAESGKKSYRISANGSQWLEGQAVALQGVRARIELSRQALHGHDRPAAVQQAVATLRHALKMHHGRWSEEEIARVCALLEHTAKAISDGSSLAPTQE